MLDAVAWTLHNGAAMLHPTLTPKQFHADTMLERRLGLSLGEFLEREHTAGHSLESISKTLLLSTAGDVSVTISTVRRWLTDFGITE